MRKFYVGICGHSVLIVKVLLLDTWRGMKGDHYPFCREWLACTRPDDGWLHGPIMVAWLRAEALVSSPYCPTLESTPAAAYRSPSKHLASSAMG